MKAKSIVKRELSLLLVVLLLLSCWVFSAPTATVSSAATAGSYDFKFVYYDSDDGCNSESSCYVKYNYKTNNGNGTEVKDQVVINQKKKLNNSGEGNGISKVVEVPGFITYVYASGTCGTGSYPTFAVHVYCKKHGDGDDKYKNVVNWTFWEKEKWGSNDGNGSKGWNDFSNKPTKSSISITGNSSLTLRTDGSAQTGSYSAKILDQYGVAWYQDVDSFSVSNATGISLSGKESATLTALSTANASSNYNVTLTAKASGLSNKTMSVTINTFDYYVYFYTDSNKTNIVQYNNANYQTIDYGGSAGVPTVPTKPSTDTYHYRSATDETKPGDWAGDTYSTLTSGAQTRKVYATYTQYSHSGDSWAWKPNESTGKHQKVCAICSKTIEGTHSYTAKTVVGDAKASDATCTEKAKYYYSCAQCARINTSGDTFEYGNVLNHSYPNNWSDYGNAEKHRKVCGNDSTHILYEDHSFTAEEVKQSALVHSATCDLPAQYYRSCDACGRVDTDPDNTFFSGDPISTHDWGNPVDFSSNGNQITQTIYKKLAQSDWGFTTSGTDSSGVDHKLEATYNSADYHVATCRDFETHKKYTQHTPTATSYYYKQGAESNVPAQVLTKLSNEYPDYQYAVDLENPESSPGQHFTYCTVQSCYHITLSNHIYTDTVVPATCEENGYTRHQCACGYYYDTDFVPATGHKYDSYTDNGNGTHSATCINTNERTGQPCGYTLTEVCSYTLELVLKDGEGNITNAARGATCEVDARCFKSCQHCKSVATTDETDETGNATVFEALNTALGHSFTKLIKPEPTDGGTACVIYYQCSRCDVCSAQKYEESTGEYVADETRTFTDAQAAETELGNDESLKVQAPTFNPSDSTAFYGVPYVNRPSQMRLTDLNSEGNTQTLRFVGSVKIPSGVDYKVDLSNDADDVVLDFGFVWTQTRYISDSVTEGTETVGDNTYPVYTYNNPNPSNLVIGGNMIQKMSVVAKNQTGDTVPEMNADASNWTGCTHWTANGGSDHYYSFNLVVAVKPGNWAKQYCARPYITYRYHGQPYTVYDAGVSNTTEGGRTYSFDSVQTLASKIMARNFLNLNSLTTLNRNWKKADLIAALAAVGVNISTEEDYKNYMKNSLSRDKAYVENKGIFDSDYITAKITPTTTSPRTAKYEWVDSAMTKDETYYFKGTFWN